MKENIDAILKDYIKSISKDTNKLNLYISYCKEIKNEKVLCSLIDINLKVSNAIDYLKFKI